MRKTGLRLLTLAAFFNFSGIHNGYSAVQWGEASVGDSIQLTGSALGALSWAEWHHFAVAGTLRAERAVKRLFTSVPAARIIVSHSAGPSFQNPFTGSKLLARVFFKKEEWKGLKPAEAPVAGQADPAIAPLREGLSRALPAWDRADSGKRKRLIRYARSDCGADGSFSTFKAGNMNHPDRLIGVIFFEAGA